MRNNMKVWIRALAIAIVAVPVLSLASDLAAPISFSPTTLIKSADVNSNFLAIQTAVNSKQDNITGICSAGQAVTGVANVGGALTCAAVGGLAGGDSVSGTAAGSGVTAASRGGGAGREGAER